MSLISKLFHRDDGAVSAGVSPNGDVIDRMNEVGRLLVRGSTRQDYERSLRLIAEINSEYAIALNGPPKEQKPVPLIISLITGAGYDCEDVIIALLLRYGDTVQWWMEYFSDDLSQADRPRILSKHYLATRQMIKDKLRASGAVT